VIAIQRPIHWGLTLPAERWGRPFKSPACRNLIHRLACYRRAVKHKIRKQCDGTPAEIVTG
jgi:hypothetical protein